MEKYKEEAIIPVSRVLLEQFLCPICCGTIENAHRVFPCLHYFCGGCIQRAFSTIQNVTDGKVKHHCPACRHVIPSKRHIIKDPKFDEIIRGLNLFQHEEDANINISTYQEIHSSRVEAMKKYQTENKELILSKPYIAPASSNVGTNKRGARSRTGRKVKARGGHDLINATSVSEPDLVNFALRQFNQGANEQSVDAKYSLSRPYVRAESTATMLDLKLLLCSYFTDIHESCVEIFVWNSQHATMIYLENDLTLGDYCEKIWDNESAIILFYSFLTS